MATAAESVLHHILSWIVLPEAELHDALLSVKQQGLMNRPMDGLTLAQWAVKESKDQEMLRLLQKQDANLDLALRTAATDSSLTGTERNKMCIFLLSIGADPNFIDEAGSSLDSSPDATLVMKYFFERARTCDTFKKMRKHIARLEQIAAPSPKGAAIPRLPRLPELFFTLTGQLPAAHIVVEKITAWAFRLARQPKPLVLLFCGPSGHGKTEMAETVSALIAGEGEHFKEISCESMRTATEIFGLGGAYQGAAQGSELNNFIRAHHGRPAVVVLDEFEKAEGDVADTLLNILDKGEWQDKKLEKGRSQTSKVDCNRIVWILTTNAFDPAVIEFAKENPWLVRFVGEPTLDLGQKVDAKLRKLAQTKFSPSFAGRIDTFVPFFPFASGDTIREKEVHTLIDQTLQGTLDFHLLQKNNAHCNIKVAACAQTRADFADIAKVNYVPAEGVRSVRRCIDRYISDPIENMWARGEIGREGGTLRMVADTDTSSTSFLVEACGEVSTDEEDAASWTTSGKQAKKGKKSKNPKARNGGMNRMAVGSPSV